MRTIDTMTSRLLFTGTRVLAFSSPCRQFAYVSVFYFNLHFFVTIVSEVVRVTITAVKQHDSGGVGFGHVVTSFFGPIGTSQPYQSCLVLVLSVEYTGADFYWLFFFVFLFFCFFF